MKTKINQELKNIDGSNSITGKMGYINKIKGE